MGLAAWAVPAKPGLITYQLPDGGVVTVTLHGDEHSHYYLSQDGYVLTPDAEGNLLYATTNIAARDGRTFSAEERATLDALNRDELLAMASQAAAMRRAVADRRRVELITSYPTIGSPKVLILLIQFADQKFMTANPQQAINSLINQPDYSHNGATGSAADYFSAQSSGLFTPEFEVMGPVTVPNNEAYYGAQEGQMYDCRAWEMITDGCKQLDAEHPEMDWSEFDNDNDGFVDIVFVFYAGRGQNEGAASWTIWPHAANVYTYYNINLEFDGVKIGNYACTNEIRGVNGSDLTGIGTFCHEYSHILGLPDLYPTNGSGAFTPGYFEVMDRGSYNNNSNTPPNYSAYDRASVGWLKYRELSGPENVTLNNISTNEALKIPTIKDTEYFILENRQQQGWDASIPGHGMLIWHIDYDEKKWNDNQVNNTVNHQNVDIVEADGVPSSTSQAGDPFPGTSNVQSFTRNSTPAMTTWHGVDPDMPLTDIREVDGIITFKVKSGGEPIKPVEALEATDVTATSFTAHWTSRPEIESYEIDLCLGREVIPFRTLTAGAGTDALRITGLTPSTTYRYVVRALDGTYRTADSNEISVTTADPSFDMLAPQALVATEVGADSFTAQWNAMDGADAYELSVYSKDVTDPEVTTVDFSASTLVPEGWGTNSNTTVSIAGYFGQARPALRLSFDGSQVSTPIWTDDVNNLSFWYRGQRTTEIDRIDIEGYIADKWQVVATVSPLSDNEGQTVTIEGMPNAVKAVRIIFRTEGTSANVSLDDVSVGHGGVFIPVYVADFNGKNVGNVTSHQVKGLEKQTSYFYTVTALQGDTRSLPSDEITVTTALEGAITDVTSCSERSELYYDLQGRRISRPAAPGLYIHGSQKILRH